MGSPVELPTLRLSPTALAASLLSEGIDVRVRLSGWSMKPLVPSGSTIRFSAGEEPAVGDVVLVRHAGGRMVAHRVLAIDGERVWTKGDACFRADAPVPRSSVLACAVALESFFAIPLRNACMRQLGLAASRIYPRLVRGFRALRPRKDEAPC